MVRDTVELAAQLGAEVHLLHGRPNEFLAFWREMRKFDNLTRPHIGVA